MKQIIRLTESDLHKIVKESVEKILKEESVVAQDPTQEPYDEDDEDDDERYWGKVEGDIDAYFNERD